METFKKICYIYLYIKVNNSTEPKELKKKKKNIPWLIATVLIYFRRYSHTKIPLNLYFYGFFLHLVYIYIYMHFF